MGVLGVFVLVDFVADDLAAKEIDNDVEFIIDAADEAGEPGYVPSPDLVGCGGVVIDFGLLRSGFAGTPAAFVELLIGKDAVEGGFRGDVGIFVEKGGNDLARWHGCETRRGAGVDDLLPLLRGEGVAGRWLCRCGTAVALGVSDEVFAPTGDGAVAEADFLGAAHVGGSGGDGFVDEGEEVFALRESG